MSLSEELLSAPASVDWCEPNFVVMPQVAEFYNTVSSLYMVVLGVVATVVWRRSEVGKLWRFGWSFAGLGLVGLGSAAFHGTLQRWAQALDELPMVWLGLVGVWIVLQRDPRRQVGPWLTWGMLAFAALFTVAYALWPAWFVMFVGTYGLLVTWMVLASLKHTWMEEAPPEMRWLFVGSALTYLGSLFGCWVPEHVLLGCDHPLQALQLHALWHVGAGTGTLLWLWWAVVDRRRLGPA